MLYGGGSRKAIVEKEEVEIGDSYNPKKQYIVYSLIDYGLLENKIEIYTLPDKETYIEIKFEGDTIWLNQYQLADLFDTDRTSVIKHLQNIYATEELDEKATCAKIAQVRQEGTRMVNREVLHYNLDAILSVGYRVNSKRGTQFRQWAAQRLKNYLLEGIVVNEKRLAQKNQELQVLHDGIRIISRAIETKTSSEDFSWLNDFKVGLQLLDDYDHASLDKTGLHKQTAKYPEMHEYMQVIEQMRKSFETDLFGKIKDGGFQSATQQIRQGFGNNDHYVSIEEKAAMLLYMVIKNHAFVDGNKRIAAACFLLFLDRNRLLYKANKQTIISTEALAGLTLLVAASKAEEMETVRELLVSVLNRSML